MKISWLGRIQASLKRRRKSPGVITEALSQAEDEKHEELPFPPTTLPLCLALLAASGSFTCRKVCCISPRELSTNPNPVLTPDPPARWIQPFPPSPCRDRWYSPRSQAQTCLQARSSKTLHFTGNTSELYLWRSPGLRRDTSICSASQKLYSPVIFCSGSTAGEN